MDYTYENIKKGTRQYDDIDVNSGPVEARYIKSDVYPGNMLIEALVRPRTRDEILQAYSAGIPGYGTKRVSEMSEVEKIEELTMLKFWRFPLPYQERLEQQFYLSQLVAYAGRKVRIVTDENGDKRMMFESDGSAPNEAFSLLGFSGAGKSTSISKLLEDYPQVLVHEPEENFRFIQITYLYVVAPVNSNMRTLMDNIAAAIDSALGYGYPVYEKAMKNVKTVGAKATFVGQLCRNFAIGTIIIDEIQYVDFKTTQEGSFNSLLTITNESGTNISVIGTEEAYKSMFETLKMQRRTGKLIRADNYCARKQFFATLVKSLVQYQWIGDEPIKPDEEMVDALYRLSGGIIDILVTIWMYINLEAIQTGEVHRIDAQYVNIMAEKHMPKLNDIIGRMRKEENAGLKKKLAAEAFDLLEVKKAEASERAVTEQLERDADRGEMMKKSGMTNNVIKNIQAVCRVTKNKYSDTDIKRAVGHVMSIGANLDADEDTLTDKAYAWLTTNAIGSKCKKTRKVKKDSDEMIEVQSELIGNVAVQKESK